MVFNTGVFRPAARAAKLYTARVQCRSWRYMATRVSGARGGAPIDDRDQARDQARDGSGGAVVERLSLKLATDQVGALSNLTVAVKDSYDIAGFPTGNGSPDWLESHPVVTATAPAVDKLLKAGATVVAKTVMDEMAYSIEGQNHHYGTPLNPASPDRIPGGSSSGSASAVAQGLADIGLGGDTGGSIRIPASFCGLFGFRPTHGRVNIAGSVPLAPSFDTGGAHYDWRLPTPSCAPGRLLTPNVFCLLFARLDDARRRAADKGGRGPLGRPQEAAVDAHSVAGWNGRLRLVLGRCSSSAV